MSGLIRADHVGSLLRPAELLHARTSQSDPSEIEAVENLHILQVLRHQKELGLSIYTDGELRRTNFMSNFTDAVEGFDFGGAVSRQWKGTGDEAQTAADKVSSINGIVTAPLRQRQPLTGRELPFLKEHAPGPIKITLPSATQFPAISFKYGITARLIAIHSQCSMPSPAS
jgi:5-methyltetrahydropteroyltriglutamate--homocysteine methyltransferase